MALAARPGEGFAGATVAGAHSWHLGFALGGLAVAPYSSKIWAVRESGELVPLIRS